MSDDQMMIVTGTAKVKADCLDDALAASLEHVRRSGTEPQVEHQPPGADLQQSLAHGRRQHGDDDEDGHGERHDPCHLAPRVAVAHRARMHLAQSAPGR